MEQAYTAHSQTLENRARQIVAALGGTWSHGKGMCRCPAHDDRTPSLAIGLGADRILFHCFAGCPSADVLAAFARHTIRIRDLFDGSNPLVAQPLPAVPNVNAARLWREAHPLGQTLADAYLLARAIGLRSPDLRFHPHTPLGKRPDVRFLPALIAAVRMDSGLVAVHRTFFDPVSFGKADFPQPKRALGSLGSGAVRLSPPRKGTLGLAEGVESALSAQIMCGIPCWATLGSERFGVVAIPDSIDELHLFVDADAGGDRALARGLRAYARPGRTIIPHAPPKPGHDWNDALVECVATKEHYPTSSEGGDPMQATS